MRQMARRIDELEDNFARLNAIIEAQTKLIAMLTEEPEEEDDDVIVSPFVQFGPEPDGPYEYEEYYSMMADPDTDYCNPGIRFI